MGQLGSLLRIVVAAVWGYQGLWCKVMGRRPGHQAIVAQVPGIGDQRARVVVVGIGAVETALAVWVLSGRAPVRAAVAQTALLIGMNGGGLLFARDRIPDVRRMLVRNAGLVAVIWTIAALRRPP